METSISQLKNLLRAEKLKPKEEQKYVTLLQNEINFLKKHMHMNIGIYRTCYKEILNNELNIQTPFDRLSDEEVVAVQKYMAGQYQVRHEDFWFFITLYDIKEPHLRLWYEITKK